MSNSSNARIAKNTMFLYFRMLFSMVVSLYTSRVVLNALGASDFGLYNVIGGVISILSVLTVLVSSGTQRFLNYEMGQDATVSRLRGIFTSSLTIYLALYGIIFLLAETIGLWFVNNKLVIPNERMFAANLVYQVTVVQMLLSFIRSTYTSAILAHERMDIYGYVGVGEPILRLLLISLLPYCFFDKLIAYSIIVFLMGLSVSVFYILFCRKHFEECRFRISKDIAQIKQMLSFTVWNLFEALSNTLSGQGLNILLNLFFGPVVNAARAIAFQVNNAVHGFASNFLIAMFPQITKNYSAGNIKEFYSLMIRGGKFSFIVLSVLMIPIMLNTEYILSIWLKTPPENSALFVNLVLLAELVRMVSEPLYTGIQATGKIRNYQIVTNSVTLLNLPLCYVLLKVWHEPAIVFYTTIGVSFFFVISRIYYVHKLAAFPSVEYLKVLLYKCVIPFGLSFLPLYFINNRVEINIWSFLIISIVAILWSCILFGLISLTRGEKAFIKNIVQKKLHIEKSQI